MSLIVTFNGQFKNYNPTQIEHTHRLERMSRIAPVFNDLLHEYLNDDVIRDQHPNSKNQKKLNHTNDEKLKSYQKSSKGMTRKLYARDIMTKDIHSIESNKTLKDAIQLMGLHQFHHLPVVDNNIMQGILSDRLIFKALANGKSLSSKVDSIMVKKVLTAQDHTSISDIARAMLVEKISCLPILDKKLSVKGVITTSDILSLMISSFPIEIYG